MIGAMIAKIIKDKGFRKTEVAKLIGIDTGHLTHIEKGERKPSIKTLKSICRVCDIPYQPLLYTLDKDLPKGAIKYNSVENISYTKILAFDDINSISNFIDCPTYKPSASFAIKITDDSMLNTFDLDTYAYIELNAPLEPGDIGLFEYDGKFMIRKLSFSPGKRNYWILKADNPKYSDIIIEDLSTFYMIGRVIQ